MNVNSYLSPRMMVGAAIVGLVGAAGVFIYEQVYAEKRRAMLVSEVARLDRQVASMRTELEALRELQKETHMRRARPKPRVKREVAPAGDATDSEYFTDCQSLIGTDIDMDSEEFYDVPSDEEDTLRESLRNGHVAKVDNENTTITDDSKSSKDST
ncbi:uncharacterized protein LOC113391652 [Vanessa tameamea]|uniref:Uncharacterized protein LOC113391652 n=1 Tax=Vanessa tameamea TaxID=334116 RepID=A0A8B8HJA5_VANTA|nr:uncharacterized protein LOC113391652 [Vanessa tameamea]XP_047542682.1 uncharacterized protein LOC125075109 [Vanessa atalanta]